jgi:hypothetical protein
MADDAEFRAALIAFCRAEWESDPEFFGNIDFEQHLLFVLNSRGPNSDAEMFRWWHALYGRYPTFDELNKPRPKLLSAPRPVPPAEEISEGERHA